MSFYTTLLILWNRMRCIRPGGGGNTYKRRALQVLHCQEHPRGREFWLDEIRWLLEACHPRDMEPWMRQMVYREIVMLLRDDERFVTYLTLVAVKPENRLSWA